MKTQSNNGSRDITTDSIQKAIHDESARVNEIFMGKINKKIDEMQKVYDTKIDKMQETYDTMKKELHIIANSVPKKVIAMYADNSYILLNNPNITPEDKVELAKKGYSEIKEILNALNDDNANLTSNHSDDDKKLVLICINIENGCSNCYSMCCNVCLRPVICLYDIASCCVLGKSLSCGIEQNFQCCFYGNKLDIDDIYKREIISIPIQQAMSSSNISFMVPPVQQNMDSDSSRLILTNDQMQNNLYIKICNKCSNDHGNALWCCCSRDGCIDGSAGGVIFIRRICGLCAPSSVLLLISEKSFAESVIARYALTMCLSSTLTSMCSNCVENSLGSCAGQALTCIKFIYDVGKKTI